MWDGLFYPIPTRIMDSFSCSPLNTFFIGENDKKASRKSSICLDAAHGAIIVQFGVRQFVFNRSQGLVWVCEMELSHMGKMNKSPDLVCEKFISIFKVHLWKNAIKNNTKNNSDIRHNYRQIS